MLNKLKNMDAETMSFYTINMNSFSDAPALQVILEQPLEKKSGVRYGPPGARRLVYFVDDMNMPFVDKYDTQSAIELLRQMIDYNGWSVSGVHIGLLGEIRGAPGAYVWGLCIEHEPLGVTSVVCLHIEYSPISSSRK